MNNKQADASGPAGLVTIDVEPDNIWADMHSRSVNNVERLPFFHRMCREFGVRPTYLVSWVAASNSAGASIIETLLSYGDCEVGIHPHLWETPPLVEKDYGDRAWIGKDYPESVLAAKLESLKDLVMERFGAPVSHRAGRWGMEARQNEMLVSLGIRTDTSVTPGVDWSVTGAPDYTAAPLMPYRMGEEDICSPGAGRLMEVPCTIKPGLRFFPWKKSRCASAMIRRTGLGNKWLRPSPGVPANALLDVCFWASSRLPHLNLMSHSSEFMAGGSPYWPAEADVARQFDAYRAVFGWWRNNGIRPMTLSEFTACYAAAGAAIRQ